LERTQQINTNSNSSTNNDQEREYTPPPIEGLDRSHSFADPPPIESNDISNSNTDQRDTDPLQSTSSTTNNNVRTQSMVNSLDAMNAMNAMNAANPLINPLYSNPLLLNQYGPSTALSASLYTDSLASKSNRNSIDALNPLNRVHHPSSMPMLSPNNGNQQHSMYPDRDRNGRKPERQRRRFHDRPRDAFDPMNPANPSYNYLLSKNNDSRDPMSRNRNPSNINTDNQHSQFNQQQPNIPTQHIPHTQQPLPPSQSTNQQKPPPVVVQQKKKKDEDITKMGPVARPIEVIMDPKLKALMPSSMRFKRKFAKPKAAQPAKKRKLDIAPDVDNVDGGKGIGNKSNRNTKNSYNAVNADAAYDKFMDEISGLI